MIDAIQEFLDTSVSVAEAPRWPVIRTGKREPICPLVRWLVWHRDGGRCKFCGSSHRTELDHVIPWSAGGSDESANLRVLCHHCNQSRSNRTLVEWPRIIPVVRWCDDCLSDEDWWRKELYKHQGDLVFDHVCDTCAATHEPRIGDLGDDQPTPAFCGYCLTIQTVSDRRRLL